MKKIPKFSLVDYIIIILVICAIIFAFIHITTDDSARIEKTAFDTSTVNKIPDTYFANYRQGNIIKATVDGFNSSNDDEVSLNGTIIWMYDNGGTNVKLLLDSDNQTYLLGIYKSIPEADIYIDKISLETDGSKYDHLVDAKLKPKNITSLHTLVDKLPNDTDYEISTTISLDSIDIVKMQEIANKINSKDKRLGILAENSNLDNQITLVRANNENIDIADSILGNFNGTTDDITIRIYNCSDTQLNAIKNNYEVMNIHEF